MSKVDIQKAALEIFKNMELEGTSTASSEVYEEKWIYAQTVTANANIMTRAFIDHIHLQMTNKTK